MTTIVEEKPKKKGRGRPRKHKVEQPKKLKKRGRKKKIDKQVINLYDIKKVELQTKKIEMKSIIVHLPINIKEFQESQTKSFVSDFLEYKPDVLQEPIGFNLNDNSLLAIEPEKVEDELIDKSKVTEYQIIDNGTTMTKKINNIMLEFKNFNNKKFFQTNICCWHCCHKFNNMPCGIPLYYEKDLFHVKGVFCSFNCALTYNYNSKENDNVIQERESLLYLLYKKIHNVKDVDIEYAPEKETLEMFGGILTIEEFRKNQNVYSVVYPPMLSIIPQLEEIKILETTDKKENYVINTTKNLKTKFSKNTSLSKLFMKK